MKLFIFVFFISSIAVFAKYDPLDTIDGTESWYKGSNEKEEAVSYYDSSYEEDVKMYLAYLRDPAGNKLCATQHMPTGN